MKRSKVRAGASGTEWVCGRYADPPLVFPVSSEVRAALPAPPPPLLPLHPPYCTSSPNTAPPFPLQPPPPPTAPPAPPTWGSAGPRREQRPWDAGNAPRCRLGTDVRLFLLRPETGLRPRKFNRARLMLAERRARQRSAARRPLKAPAHNLGV